MIRKAESAYYLQKINEDRKINENTKNEDKLQEICTKEFKEEEILTKKWVVEKRKSI